MLATLHYKARKSNILTGTFNAYRLDSIKRRHNILKSWRSRASGAHTHARISAYLKYTLNSKLSSVYKKARGKTLSGTTTVYSKCSLNKKSVIAYSQTLSNFKYFVVPVSTVKDVSSLKFATLLLTADGVEQYVRTTKRLKLFRLHASAELIKWALYSGANLLLKKQICFETFLSLRVGTRVSSVALYALSRITIARAAGTSATIISKTKIAGKTAVTVQLPSLRIKIADASVVVALGSCILKQKKNIKNTTAGYWKKLGYKQSVRGVVKNPVDHPHGGRERTILWPRTPWGKTAK